jgi:hypothetical protein
MSTDDRHWLRVLVREYVDGCGPGEVDPDELCDRIFAADKARHPMMYGDFCICGATFTSTSREETARQKAEHACLTEDE